MQGDYYQEAVSHEDFKNAKPFSVQMAHKALRAV